MSNTDLARCLSVILWFNFSPVNALSPIKNLAHDYHYYDMRKLIIQHKQQDGNNRLHRIRQSLIEQLQQLKKFRDSTLRKYYSVGALSMPFALIGTLWIVKKPIVSDNYYRINIYWGHFAYLSPSFNSDAAKKCIGITFFASLFFMQGVAYILGYDADENYAELQGDKQIARIEELIALIDQ